MCRTGISRCFLFALWYLVLILLVSWQSSNMFSIWFLKRTRMSGSSHFIQRSVVCRAAAAVWVLSSNKVENSYLRWVSETLGFRLWDGVWLLFFAFLQWICLKINISELSRKWWNTIFISAAIALSFPFSRLLRSCHNLSLTWAL